jgi:post-segregation antitoxin (ccd killing protein)
MRGSLYLLPGTIRLLVYNNVYIDVNRYPPDIMSVTVSVRIEEEELREIKELGLNPGELIRDLLRKELRKKRVQKTLRWLKENRIDTDGPGSIEILRELRDTRWA